MHSLWHKAVVIGGYTYVIDHPCLTPLKDERLARARVRLQPHTHVRHEHVVVSHRLQQRHPSDDVSVQVAQYLRAQLERQRREHLLAVVGLDLLLLEEVQYPAYRLQRVHLLPCDCTAAWADLPLRPARFPRLATHLLLMDLGRSTSLRNAVTVSSRSPCALRTLSSLDITLAIRPTTKEKKKPLPIMVTMAQTCRLGNGCSKAPSTRGGGIQRCKVMSHYLTRSATVTLLMSP